MFYFNIVKYLQAFVCSTSILLATTKKVENRSLKRSNRGNLPDPILMPLTILYLFYPLSAFYVLSTADFDCRNLSHGVVSKHAINYSFQYCRALDHFPKLAVKTILQHLFTFHPSSWIIFMDALY